ncbi:MFS transporter [Sphingomonas sp. dw_22]|uniref:MFS transporter n=1 Tax=Sphingomonas sp. dw_22 TaxID=2721175 RepID=UPI001BD5124D|nr:MFS transporter [Sphingomonas sp. dw_22]
MSARRTANPLLVLLTASTGCAMTVLDTNVVAIILPTIARDFGASFADVEWVVSTYVLCFAALLLPAGAIADRFGRRRVFLIGIGAFAAASLLCGIAPSAALLYLARALQGAGAAFLLAPALAVIGHTFHGEAERNRAWAIWGAMMGLTMVLAPILGGLIAHALGWRWAFHINVPICAALAGAALLFIDESRDEGARRLDPAGIVLFATTMFGLTWGLINGQAHGWTSPSAVTGFIGGIAALIAFVIAERRQERPMLDLALFGNPRLVGAVWAMFAYAACAQVMASLLPLFLQNGLGRSALQAGFAMLPFAAAMLAFPQIGRLLGRRLASRQILTLGLLIVGLGNALTGWGAYLGAWPIVMAGMLVLGSGGGLLNGETQKAIMSVVPRERAGMASGISTTARFSGILLGFAMLSGILATVVRTALGAEHRAFADAVVAGDLPHAASGLAGRASQIVIERAHIAYSSGFAAMLTVAALIAWASALLVWRLMRDRRQ